MSSTYDAAMVDEAMLEDERLLDLDRSTRLLHIEATVWSKARRTDGSIPERALGRLTDAAEPAAQAAALVTAGLWERTTGGWALADFLGRQLSRAQVEARVASHRESQRRYDRKRADTRSPDTSDDRSPDVRTDGQTDRPTDRKVEGGLKVGRPAAGADTAAAPAPAADLTHVACQDYTRHQRHHRRRGEGWVCDVCERRELGRFIREAPTESMRDRYRRAFDKAFGQLYPRAGT